MFDAMKVLGAMLENGAAPSAPGRLTNAMQESAGSGGLQDILGGLLGGGGQAGGAGGGMAGGLGGLLGGLLGGGGGQGQPQQQQAGGGGLADILGGLTGMLGGGGAQQGGGGGMGGLGSLAGALRGGGQGAMGGGLMAILAGLAQSTLQGRGAGGGGMAAAPMAAPPMASSMPRAEMPSREKGYDKGGAMPAHIQALHDPDATQRKATLILRAMIEAAKADGQIDQAEVDRIGGKLNENPEARDFVVQEMRRPLDIAGLCAGVADAHEAVEVYAASLMAIEVDTQAEQDYLAQLAEGLGLSAELVGRIHQQLGLPA